MKKNFMTTMPDKVGAFLKAGKCLAKHNINITRTSYNKSVDVHTLFIEAEGSQEDLMLAQKELEQIGFLNNKPAENRFYLLEFCLCDRPGAVVSVLEIINELGFNISYMSARQTDGETQNFRIGFVYDHKEKVDSLIDKAKELCPVRVVDYDKTELKYDNSVFYNTYADGLAALAGLPEEAKRKLAVNTNRALQTLDENGNSAYLTFDSIRHFCEHIVGCKGSNFDCRITWNTLTKNTDLIIIEPPCGSNTMILRNGGRYLYIDTGYACFKEETEGILRRLFADYDTAPREVILTHADVDHIGLLGNFDKVYLSRLSYNSLKAQYEGQPDLREQNPVHLPYVRISKLLTFYEPISTDTMEIISSRDEQASEPIVKTGHLDFGDMSFDVYEGAGGHLKGEIVLTDHTHKITFTGDIYINVHGLTEKQAKHNSYAPILMTAVDSDPALAAKERAELKRMFHGYTAYGSHGQGSLL